MLLRLHSIARWCYLHRVPFVPRLIRLWELGKFPVERLMVSYDFDQIEQAAHDAENGKVVKSVLRMS